MKWAHLTMTSIIHWHPLLNRSSVTLQAFVACNSRVTLFHQITVTCMPLQIPLRMLLSLWFEELERASNVLRDQIVRNLILFSNSGCQDLICMRKCLHPDWVDFSLINPIFSLSMCLPLLAANQPLCHIQRRDYTLMHNSPHSAVENTSILERIYYEFS